MTGTGVVHRGTGRGDRPGRGRLAQFGPVTVHEAMGRTGLPRSGNSLATSVRTEG